MKTFFENIDRLMKTQDSSRKEQYFVTYADVILSFCNSNNYIKLHNPYFCSIEVFIMHTLPVLEKKVNEQSRLIFCNEVIYLLKNYVLDKLYNELLDCNLENNSLNNAFIIDEMTPVINELYSACNNI